MSKISRATTCGVLVTDGEHYLICHPTMSKWWDIPKGKQEANEPHDLAAIRELREETGINASTSELSYIGLFDYKPEKQLALYKLLVTEMYDVSNLKCTSYFSLKGKQYPEMDVFKVVSKDVMLKKVSPALTRVLNVIL